MGLLADYARDGDPVRGLGKRDYAGQEHRTTVTLWTGPSGRELLTGPSGWAPIDGPSGRAPLDWASGRALLTGPSGGAPLDESDEHDRPHPNGMFVLLSVRRTGRAH
ncbi:unnamed protein product [Arctogadus glacialis]